MTENKRFTVHIGWYNYDKTDGEIELKDNGQPILLSESIEDVQLIKRLLNELSDENEQLRHDATVLIQSNQEYRKENDELKQYKQAVSDILWDWYRKDGSLTIWRIMKELNVDGDVE